MLILLLTVFSCESSPGTAGDAETGLAGKEKPDAAEMAAEESGSGTGETGTEELSAEGGGAEELPVAEATPGEPPEAALTGDLREPEIDLAEADAAALPPAEEGAGAALPEPAPPVLPEPPPAVPPPPPPEQPPPAVPPPALPESPPPAPPPFLGPAEEAPPAEPVPAPARPRPEAPVLSPAPAKPEEEIVFSRRVRATAGQLVEIPFRGAGWVYLGELGARRGIVYDSRRLDPEGQSFVFRAEAAGTYALKFYRQDFIRDFILNDYVQVTVGEAPEPAGSGWFNPPLDRGRVRAEPRWPTSLEEAEAVRRGGRPAAGAGQAAESGAPPSGGAPADSAEAASPARFPAPSVPAGEGVPAAPPAGQTPENPDFSVDSPPEDYFRKAREEFGAGRAASAISVLDQFRERNPAGSDEACWLYGQFYEADSPARDILKALDYYRRLVREYPQSSRCDSARRRIAYLERYYINIR
ncbi:MAG: hypothetical protein LBP27_07175 [Treponema sp.]|nr:hypothetical protein [Treponema sp.]